MSSNVMHSSMDITDEVYSRLDNSEVRRRIENLGIEMGNNKSFNKKDFKLFQEFLNWQKGKKFEEED